MVVGLGQLGRLFADGFLRLGRPVVPILRGESLEAKLGGVEPEVVLVAVGEDELSGVLRRVPAELRDRVALLQNELRPAAWLEEGYADPSVAIVWFERKNDQPPRAVEPTRLFGGQAPLLERALRPLDVRPLLQDPAELPYELCLKNLYILTTNLAGLEVGGTTSELLDRHGALFERVFRELLLVERALFGATVSLDEERLRSALETALRADPSHGTAGRSARRRLERTLDHARALGLEVPTLASLGEKHLS